MIFSLAVRSEELTFWTCAWKAGSSDDVRHVVLWISATFPRCRMYGLGEHISTISASPLGLADLITTDQDFRWVQTFSRNTLARRAWTAHSRVL